MSLDNLLVRPVTIENERGSLGDLAEIANREDGLVGASESRALQAVCDGAMHAMAAGDALLYARDRLEAEGLPWRQWCNENLHFSWKTGNRYLRMATYREEIEEWIGNGGRGTIKEAAMALRGLPPTRTTARPEEHAEAERLHAEGMGPTAIAKTLGVNFTTVRAWLSPDYRAARHEVKRRKEQADRHAIDAPAAHIVRVRTEMEVAADTIWLLCSSGLIDIQRVAVSELCAAAGITPSHLVEAKTRSRTPRALVPRPYRVVGSAG